eukprot:4497809-Pyramimonas_sp.AAC.1
MARAARSGIWPRRISSKTCATTSGPSGRPRIAAQCSNRAPVRPGPECLGNLFRAPEILVAASPSQ